MPFLPRKEEKNVALYIYLPSLRIDFNFIAIVRLMRRQYKCQLTSPKLLSTQKIDLFFYDALFCHSGWCGVFLMRLIPTTAIPIVSRRDNFYLRDGMIEDVYTTIFIRY